MAFPRLLSRRSAREESDSDEAETEPAAPKPPPEMFFGVTLEPEEGAAFRINSALDVDPNMKARGVAGQPGGAGGFGGAGVAH